MANPGRIEEVLQAGAAKARKLATPFMVELREAVGLRNLSVAVSQDKAAGKKAKGARFVSFPTTVVSLPPAGGRWRRGAAVAAFRRSQGSRQCMRRVAVAAFADPKEAGSACVGCRKPCRMSCCKSGG